MFGGAIAGSISTSFGLRNFVNAARAHLGSASLRCRLGHFRTRALDRRLAFECHAERGEESDSSCKVVDDDADVVQSLNRHVSSMAGAVRAVQANRSRDLDVVGRENQGVKDAVNLMKAGYIHADPGMGDMGL